MRLSGLLLALLWLDTMAQVPPSGPIGTVRIEIARKVGYVIGDLIPYDAVVTVDPSWTLRDSSLPSPGRPQYWLELRKVESSMARSPAGRVYRIHLLYQSFYAPLEARKRDLPGFALTFEHRGGSSEIAVPAVTVTMAPLREVATGTGDPEENVALEPDRLPAPVSLQAPATGIAVASSASLFLYLIVAWQQARWPFSQRPARPFARSARALRLAGTDEPAKYAAALLSLHRAFDTAAGWRVFAEDQARFLAQLPQFVAGAGEIARFFEASRYCFFGGDVARASTALPPEALPGLAHRLAVLERGT
jgi:mxaA protein